MIFYVLAILKWGGVARRFSCIWRNWCSQKHKDHKTHWRWALFTGSPHNTSFYRNSCRVSFSFLNGFCSLWSWGVSEQVILFLNPVNTSYALSVLDSVGSQEKHANVIKKMGEELDVLDLMVMSKYLNMSWITTPWIPHQSWITLKTLGWTWAPNWHQKILQRVCWFCALHRLEDRVSPTLSLLGL